MNTDPTARGRLAGVFELRAFSPDGREKWTARAPNRIVDEGCTHTLESALGGGTQVTTWYLGLTDSTPTDAAGDTLASHAGWAEVTAYAGSRPAATFAVAASKSITNSASKASYTINANSTVIGGAFLCSVATGTSGTLWSVGAAEAPGDKTLDSGDVLEVTYTATMADAG